MKYKIGQNVICKPKHQVVGYLSGHDFTARIVDIVGKLYILEDQDSDFTTVDEDEIELNNES